MTALLQEFGVVCYVLGLSLIEYKTLVMRGDMKAANQLLPSIPKVRLCSGNTIPVLHKKEARIGLMRRLSCPPCKLQDQGPVLTLACSKNACATQLLASSMLQLTSIRSFPRYTCLCSYQQQQPQLQVLFASFPTVLLWCRTR